MERTSQYVKTLDFHCSKHKHNRGLNFVDVETLPTLHLALSWSQSTGALWHFAKWLALCDMLSRTCQFWFWLMSPGAKSNSTQFIEHQLSAYHVVPTMPKDDKARSCQKLTVSKRQLILKTGNNYVTVSPWPYQSAHVPLPALWRIQLTKLNLKCQNSE